MPTDATYPPLPLARFLARLRASGIDLDPGREWRLRSVLHAEGHRFVGRFGELKYLLAPYVARTAAEQAAFYRLWDDFVAECAGEAGEEPMASTPAPAEAYPWYLRYRRELLAVALAALLLPLAYVLYQAWAPSGKDTNVPALTITAPSPEDIRENRTLRFDNATVVDPESRDSLGFRWAVRDSAGDSLLAGDTTFHFTWRVPAGSGRRVTVILRGPPVGDSLRPPDSLDLIVRCAAPPDLSRVSTPAPTVAKDETGRFAVSTPESGVRYQWTFGADTLRRYGPTVEYSFAAEGETAVRLRAVRTTDSLYCYADRSWIFTVGSDLPLVDVLPLREDEPGQLLRAAGWIWALALLPLLASLWFWRRWRNRRRVSEQTKTPEELAAEFPIYDAGPYTIPYRSRANRIQVPPDFFRLADQLRIREAGMRRRFDAPATVEATVRAGGFPAWRDRARQRPAAYLLLVRHTDEFHQQDRLLTRLAEFLTQREAALTTFFHSGDFAGYWNAEHPAGLRPEQLYSRYPEHRLIVLGDGHGLVDPYESAQPRLKPAALNTLLRWHRRLVLTTEPPVDWSFQEALLHRYFLLYPADRRGLLAGVSALNDTDEYEPGDFRRWEKAQTTHRPAVSARYREWTTVAHHRDYLADDPALYRWLCGLAVCSSPDWNLTIAIGRALGVDVTHDRLLRLSRIPWLAENAPYPTLRLALLRELSTADRAAVRQALLAELEEPEVAAAVRNSFAQTEWTVNRAVQRFALAPTATDRKQAIRDLRRLDLLGRDQLEELDYEIAERKSSAMPLTPERRSPNLDEWLDAPEPRPWFTADLTAALSLCLLSLAAVFAIWDFDRERYPLSEDGLSFWQRNEIVNDSAIILNNLAVAEWRRVDNLTQGAEARQDTLVAGWSRTDSLLNLAIQARSPDDYPLAIENRSRLGYAQARQYYHDYLLSKLTVDTFLARDTFLNATLAARQSWLEDRINADTTELMATHHLSGLSNFYLYRERSRRTTEPDLLLTADTRYVLSQLDIQAREVDRYYSALVQSGAELTRTEYDRRYQELALVTGLYRTALREGTLTVSPTEINQYLQLLFAAKEADEETFFRTLEILTQFQYRAMNKNTSRTATNLANTIYHYRYLRTAGDSSFFDTLGQRRPVHLRRLLQNFAAVDSPVPTAEADPPDPATLITPFGRVLDRTGRALNGVGVIAGRIPGDDAGGAGTPSTLTTDAEGSYTLPASEVGTVWEISVRTTTVVDTTFQYRVTEDGRIGTIRMANATVGSDVPRPDLVSIPAGTFRMGDTFGEGESDELPVHEVTLPAFQLGRYEVTFAEFDLFVERTGYPHRPSDRDWGRGRRPVINVSWYDVISYANWLSSKHGYTPVYRIADAARQREWTAAEYGVDLNENEPEIIADWNANGYRLPTEAEWEYAASYVEGTRKARFGNGRDTLRAEEANFDATEDYKQPYSEIGEYRQQTVPVGSLRSPNELGVHDMSGNVYEWVWDWYGDYGSSPVSNPKGPNAGAFRVLRGGSWFNGPAYCRAASRFNRGPTYRSNYVGFRLARS